MSERTGDVLWQRGQETACHKEGIMQYVTKRTSYNMWQRGQETICQKITGDNRWQRGQETVCDKEDRTQSVTKRTGHNLWQRGHQTICDKEDRRQSVKRERQSVTKRIGDSLWQRGQDTICDKEDNRQYVTKRTGNNLWQRGQEIAEDWFTVDRFCLVYWKRVKSDVAWSTGDVLLASTGEMLCFFTGGRCFVIHEREILRDPPEKWYIYATHWGDFLRGPPKMCCLVHRRRVARPTRTLLRGPPEPCCEVHRKRAAGSGPPLFRFPFSLHDVCSALKIEW